MSTAAGAWGPTGAAPRGAALGAVFAARAAARCPPAPLTPRPLPLPPSTFRVGKVQVSATPLVGVPWGSMWELVAGGDALQRVTE